MQLSVIFSALVSFVILAAASPTPRATEKRSSKRELDNKFMDYHEREDLKAMVWDYDTDKREDLKAMVWDYDTDKREEKREDLKAMVWDYDTDKRDSEELENKFMDYHEREE